MKFNKTVLATFMALSLTACGSGGNSSTAEKPTNTQVSQAQQSNAANGATTTKETKKAETVTTQLAETEKAQQQIESLKQQIADLEKNSTLDRNSLNTQLTQAQTALDEAQKRVKGLQQQLTDAQSSATEQQATLSAQLTDSQNQLESLKQQIADLEKNATFDRNSLNTQLTQAKTALNEAQERVKELQQQLTNAQSSATEQQTTLSAQLTDSQNQLESLQQKLDAYEKAKLEQIAEKQKAEDELKAQQAKNAEKNAQADAKFMRNLGSDERYGVSEQGFSERSYEYKDETNTSIGTERLYNQQYSIVYGQTANVRYVDGETYSPRFNVRGVHGNLTNTDSLPNEGKATYSGVAFGAFDKGDLSYTIDFANRTGSGQIDNLADVPDNSSIILEKGTIDGNTITSTATAHIVSKSTSTEDIPHEPYDLTGKYILGIYGPNAEEIAGKVELNNIPENLMRRADRRADNDSYRAEIGFGGTRGEIETTTNE